MKYLECMRMSFVKYFFALSCTKVFHLILRKGTIELFYLSNLLTYKYNNFILHKEIWVFVAVSKITFFDSHQFLKEIIISIHLIGHKNIS